MGIDKMYDVSIEKPKLDGREDIKRSLNNFHNVEVKCSVRRYGSVYHKAFSINIYVFNSFHWVLSIGVDVKNEVIANVERRSDIRIKLMDYYNNKEKLQYLFVSNALEVGFQYKVAWSTMIWWEIRCRNQQLEW